MREKDLECPQLPPEYPRSSGVDEETARKTKERQKQKGKEMNKKGMKEKGEEKEGREEKGKV